MGSETVRTTSSPLPEDALAEDLLALLREQQRPAADVEKVYQAYLYAKEKHTGQKRKNEENYIVHPVNVALILAKMSVDTATVMAALLHDVLEDTPATSEDLKQHFGEDVLQLVEGVTKLGKFKFTSQEDREAENFRKMFLAMAQDVRVMMLKLADRLHNMRTLQFMSPDKQKRIARETLEIFAPLANRMGMGKIRAELEDLSFQFLDPDRYQGIVQELALAEEEREESVAIVAEKIQTQLKTLNVEAKVYSRAKNYYSIYKKMVAQDKELQDIYDLSAARIIVPSEKECYEALGVVHSAFTPIPGRFKDYIAMPKSNLYQSLHTTVIGPYGRPLEVQIRTQKMHQIAEYGIAAHWRYKESGASVSVVSEEEQKLSWLRQMMEMKEDSDDAQEYVDSVKLDLFSDEVFVFTPKGRVVVLPGGSTPVDFAYRIHTEVGNACAGSIVNGRIVPLSHRLHNGDIIEIITNKKASPNLGWINFVKTHQAKSRIRLWFKKNFRDQHEETGRKMLTEALGPAAVEEATASGRLAEVAQALNYVCIEDLWVALGYGELTLTRVLNRLKQADTTAQFEPYLRRATAESPPPEGGRSGPRADGKNQIEGLKDMLYHLAKCCSPVPGEPIVGVVTRSRGVMVHREDCPNLVSANPERLMIIGWEGEADRAAVYSVKLEIHVIDRVGIFKDVLTQIANAQTNLSNAKVKTLMDNQTAAIEVMVDIRNLGHLDQVVKAIQRLPDVLLVRRLHHRTGRGTSAEE